MVNNKKGQSDGISTVVKLVLAAATIIIILGFGYFLYQYYYGIAVITLPEDVIIRAVPCVAYAIGNADAYCTDFVELEVTEGDIFTNCEYDLLEGEVKNQLEKQKKSFTADCGDDKGKAFCEKWKLNLENEGEEIRVWNVNDGTGSVFKCLEDEVEAVLKTCAGADPEGHGGAWKEEGDCVSAADGRVNPEEIDPADVAAHLNKACCV